MFWIVWLFAAIVFFAIAFFIKTNFRDFIYNNWGTILLLIILIGLIGLYYWHGYRNLNKWFNHYQSMLKDLDKNKGVYLECTKDDKDRMSNFINKYRHDKYLEQARKQQQKKTSCWKKLKALMPFSDI